jgi:nonribosomal peptide synthetase DhbF
LDQPVWALQARGVDDPAHGSDKTIMETVQTYLSAIKQIQPHGPYHLLGMSLGGTIAHEAAIELEKQGDVVDTLILLDTVTHYPNNYQQDEVEQRMPKSLLAVLYAQTIQDLDTDSFATLESVKGDWVARGMIPAHTDNELFLRALKSASNSVALMSGYQVGQCQAPILLIRAGFTATVENANRFNWSSATLGGVTTYTVQVEHAEMLWQPNSYSEIARIIQSYGMT